MEEEYEEGDYNPDEEAIEDGEVEDDDEEQIEQMFDARNKDVWSTSGPKKNECIRELIKYFGSMLKAVPMEYAIPDNRGRYRPEDMEYSKLLDSSKYVVKAKRALIKNENFDTRDFTIFIANKKWVKTILRPLLELCAKNDSLLAMRCCGLALVLIKRLSDTAMKYLLKDATKKPRRGANSTEEKAADDSDKDEKENVNKAKIANSKQQLSALLSFKEALCSDKCNEALTNCFKEFWEKEQEATNEDNKQGVAICFSYFRRILAIEANPLWSSDGEIAINRSVHNKYIIQLRQIMGVIPGVCSDLLRPYHNDWLADIILILYYAVNGFDSSDLFKVWKSGYLIEDFEDILDEEPETTPAPVKTEEKNEKKPLKKELMPIEVPALLKTSNTDATLKKGSLLGMIKKEKDNRNIAAQQSITMDPSRFRGVYRQPLQNSQQKAQSPPPAATSVTSNNTANTSNIFVGASGIVYGSTSIAPAAAPPATDAHATGSKATPITPDSPPPKPTAQQVARIVKNPFSTTEQVIPQVKAKNTKKNLAFADNTGKDNIVITNRLSDPDSQKACVVVATLVNLVSNEISLKPLIKRVNEDLRRDEMRVTHELESRYFELIAKILNYNRLKLADQYKSFLSRTSNTMQTNPPEVWEPNLKNVMDALDRMSFSRVIGSIERNSKPGAKHDDIAISMNLYKEMICYMRVLLESGLEGHHEIAVASLFRVFYTSSNEKLDPLPKLLSGWKAGFYSKRHLNTLVELVYETMKTLEAAQNRYKDNELASGAKKRPKPKGRKDMDLEQYIIACIAFDVNDYFKRLVQNNTIRMYTKLLSNYNRNEPAVNHYAYSFLQRMCNYKLEQEYKAPPPPLPNKTDDATTTPINNLVAVLNSGSLPYDDVHLGFMLFNIQTLLVFSTIINDSEVYSSPQYKYMEPLVRLIKSLVRRFGEASRKNKMMFVELLFHQPRPIDFCCQLDSVYEAPSYNVRDTNVWKKNKKASQYSNRDDDSENTADSGSDTDLGDEFDENNLTDHFVRSDKDDAKAKADKAAKKAERKRLKELRKLEKKKAKREAKYGWSTEEDNVLKEQYALYAGDKNIFKIITESAELRAIGKNRSEKQVIKRARELKLHEQFNVLSDEESHHNDESDHDDNESDDEAGILKGSAIKSQRSLRKRSPGADLDQSIEFSDDDNNDPLVDKVSNKKPSNLSDGESMDEELVVEGDENSPAALNSSTTTQETSGSSSARKKPRLALKNKEDKALGRAAWDVDDEVDIFEQRSLGLLGSSKNNNSGNNAVNRKLFKKKNSGKSKISDDEDDRMFADSEGDEEPVGVSQASVINTVSPAPTALVKPVNRAMMIESDDDEL